MLTVKRLFMTYFAVMAAITIATLFAVTQQYYASNVLDDALRNRYQSYLLADELRQSSDDLTRLARTYVVTGDERWEKQYWEILDIRNGKKPRPQEYQRIYWDFRAAGEDAPRPTTEAVPLQELMKRAGFTEEEFAKLKEAQGNSDDLVKTETIAMNMVKGLYDDGNGNFTKRGEPDLEKARALMHDINYHRYKAKIMKPVDEFYVLLDQRTSAAIAAAKTRQAIWQWIVFFGCAGLLGVSSVALALWYRRLMSQLGGEPQYVVEAVSRIAAGDLNGQLDVKPGDRDSVIAAVQRMQTSLSGVIGNVHGSVENISTATVEIAQGNQDLSSRTEQQASSLQQTAASMEQMTSTVKANADAAKQANQLAASASEVAARGGAVVSQVVTTMGEIQNSSKKIAEIISVIDGIAFQTNILALNAAVEAARAGEQGRGFAVVAGEVRNLAQRSAQAAREIKSLISDSVEKVESGSKLVNDAGQTMSDIVNQVKRVTDLIGEITSATLEQSSGLAQVNTAITQLDQNTQQNAALVEQSAAAAASLREQAQKLADAIAFFKLSREQAGRVIAQAQATAKASARPPSMSAPPATSATSAPAVPSIPIPSVLKSLPPATSSPMGSPSSNASASTKQEAAPPAPAAKPATKPPSKPVEKPNDDWEEF